MTPELMWETPACNLPCSGGGRKKICEILQIGSCVQQQQGPFCQCSCVSACDFGEEVAESGALRWEVLHC